MTELKCLTGAKKTKVKKSKNFWGKKCKNFTASRFRHSGLLDRNVPVVTRILQTILVANKP